MIITGEMVSAQRHWLLEQGFPRTKRMARPENKVLDVDKSSAEFRCRNAVSAAAAAME